MLHQKTDRSFRARPISLVLPIVVAFLILFIMLPRASEATSQNNNIRHVAPAPVSVNTCFAQVASGTTFTSTNAQAVRDAVAAATAGTTVKIAGICSGIQAQGGTTQTVLITQSLSLAGGYTTTNWTTSYPITQPTILDAQTGGRVLYFSGVDGTVSNLTVQNGNSAFSGSGIFASHALTLIDVTIISNTSANAGGGAYVTGAMLSTNTTFISNSATGNGGGAYFASIVTLTGAAFISNTSTGANGGGGLYAVDVANLNGGLFQNNRSTVYGGGAYFNYSHALVGTQFLSNTANAGGGGAACVNGSGAVTGSSFTGNTSPSGGGGGMYFACNSTVTGTTFTGNTAGLGGGVYFINATAKRFVNVLFARNRATTNGAAICVNNASPLNLIHTTIASPTLGSGSAIYIVTGTVGITDTIIASYSIGINLTAGTAFENYNLFSGTTISKTGSFVAGSGANDVTGDPKFVDPASDNYHLKVGSAAIDTGVNAGVFTDFDGQARPFGAGFDIGYDEYAIYHIYLPLALKNF